MCFFSRGLAISFFWLFLKETDLDRNIFSLRMTKSQALRVFFLVYFFCPLLYSFSLEILHSFGLRCVVRKPFFVIIVVDVVMRTLCVEWNGKRQTTGSTTKTATTWTKREKKCAQILASSVFSNFGYHRLWLVKRLYHYCCWCFVLFC